MRQRLLLVALALSVAFSIVLTLHNQQTVAGAPPPRERRPSRHAAVASGAAATAPADPRELSLSRNLFEYGASNPRTSSVRMPLPRVTASAPEPPAPVRPNVTLVGILHPKEGVRAALSVDGDVVLLAPGGTAFGYTVVDISEEGSVRVTTPSGDEIKLVAAPSS